MINKFVLTFLSAAVMTLNAAGAYHFVVAKDASVAGKQLKAGDYKLEIKGDVAVIKAGHQTLEVPAHVETAPVKFATTSVMYVNDSEIKQIGFGGTNTKVVFAAPATQGGGQ